MMFLSFGAPDLAMTQFSVETLTVLIYVLVFRHFRGLGPLSPRLVRARDGLIAVGIGIFIGGLLLSIATTETAPRLREYFAEFGPTLGHGRNIVNVILVDFRAFDTLGEITVLATAAIGVRGLLRFAADGRLAMNLYSPWTRQSSARLRGFSCRCCCCSPCSCCCAATTSPVAASSAAWWPRRRSPFMRIAFGVKRARQALLVKPMTLLGAGLLIALCSGLPAVLRGQPFLTALWARGPLPLGTPALFDVGVFLVVAGVVLMMIFSLAEES